jgi:hypothetical protein
MNKSEASNNSSNRNIYLGLAVGVAIGIALNVAPYFLFATPSAANAAKFHLPQLHKLGFPRPFWVENRVGAASFYWGAFLVDAIATVGIGIALAQWCEKRGKPAGTSSAEPPSPDTPK